MFKMMIFEPSQSLDVNYFVHQPSGAVSHPASSIDGQRSWETKVERQLVPTVCRNRDGWGRRGSRATTVQCTSEEFSLYCAKGTQAA